MRAISIISMLAVLLFVAAPASAEWRVEIESKSVYAGQSGVTLGFTVFWDLDLNFLAIPVVVREIDPGSFWTGTLPADTMNAVPQGVTWLWSNPGWAGLVQEFRPGPGCATPGNYYDGVSPDNFMVLAVAAAGSTPAEPGGRKVLEIEFDVSPTLGQFEFDTACLSMPTDVIYMYDTEFPPNDHGPHGTDECTFARGVITIRECDCSPQGDLNGDGMIDPIDVALLCNYAFRDGPEPPSDPDCPLVNRGDWNCDERIDLLDIVLTAHHVYRLQDKLPCDPCPADEP